MAEDILDKHEKQQALREASTRKGVKKIDRDIRALRNISGRYDNTKEIEELEGIKGLEESRIEDYDKVHERYGTEPQIEEEAPANFDEVIRSLDKQINNLEEGEEGFDEKLEKLEKRRRGLMGLNKPRF